MEAQADTLTVTVTELNCVMVEIVPVTGTVTVLVVGTAVTTVEAEPMHKESVTSPRQYARKMSLISPTLTSPSSSMAPNMADT